MSVPEASVHENDRPVFRQDKVRVTGEVLRVESIPEPALVQGLSDLQLGCRVLSPDARHYLGTSLWVDGIHG